MNYANLESPFSTPGWIAFQEKRLGIKAENVRFEGDKENWYLDALFYKRKNHFLHAQPGFHMPVSFWSSSEKRANVNRRRRIAVTEFARFCYHKKITSLKLPPGFLDISPFLGLGYKAVPSFTFMIPLDSFEDFADQNVLKKARKAERLGYRSFISSDFDAVHDCLRAPQDRNAFDYGFDANALKELASMFGSDSFFCMLALDKDEMPQGARVVISQKNGYSLGLMAGIKTDGLKDGVNSFLVRETLSLLREKGCKWFDFHGANIPAITEMKEAWGGELATRYHLHYWNGRSVAKYCKRKVVQQVRRLLRR